MPRILAKLAAHDEASLLVERGFLKLQTVGNVGRTMDGRDSSGELGDRVARLSLGDVTELFQRREFVCDFLTVLLLLLDSGSRSALRPGYPIMLSIHSIGLAMVVGITVMMDLRVLGFAKSVPLSGFSRLTDYAWAGFIINAISGVLLFMSDAVLLAVNWPFWLKMASVAVGASTFLLLTREMRLGDFHAQNGEAVLVEPAVTSKMHVLAIISICAWMVGIDSGRLIAYVIDAAVLGH